MTERTPRGEGWQRCEVPHGARSSTGLISACAYRKIAVLSGLEEAEYPDGKGAGPQWHISIARAGGRPSASDTRKALRSFGMVGAEEDNHHSGNARHFWLPVDPAHRVDCQCKASEDTIVEKDGYKWTNPKEGTGEACRGCEGFAITGRPCPIHLEGAQ